MTALTQTAMPETQRLAQGLIVITVHFTPVNFEPRVPKALTLKPGPSVYEPEDMRPPTVSQKPKPIFPARLTPRRSTTGRRASFI
jgi:hypothetical protein